MNRHLSYLTVEVVSCDQLRRIASLSIMFMDVCSDGV